MRSFFVGIGIVPEKVWNEIGHLIVQRFLILFVYLMLTTFLVLDWGIWQIFLWWIGVCVSWCLLDVDHLIDVFWINSDLEVNREAHLLLGQRDWAGLWLWLVVTAKSRKRLILHSALFLAAVLLLSLYVATSGENMFAKGLVLGLLGRMAIELLILFVSEWNLGIWLWQLTDDIAEQLQGVLVVIAVVGWIWLTVKAL